MGSLFHNRTFSPFHEYSNNRGNSEYRGRLKVTWPWMRRRIKSFLDIGGDGEGRGFIGNGDNLFVSE